jgi:hypothetical protein
MGGRTLRTRVAEEDHVGIVVALKNGKGFAVGRKLEVSNGVVLKMGDGPCSTSLDGLLAQILDAIACDFINFAVRRN